jgi:tetratricopeptide (TPR) repeat protein
MFLKKIIAPLALGLALSASAVASEATENAAATFDQGLVVLSNGDFDGAMKAFKVAAKTDPENQKYRQHVALVSRVKQVRGMLANEKDLAQWAKIAKSLRSFYGDYEIYGEALTLDTKRHAKLCTTGTGVDLADSQLEMNKNADAVKVLSSLKKSNSRSNVLLGIALARTGDMASAKKLAGAHASKKSDDVQLNFDSACLNSLVGNTALAADQLTIAFEQIPADRLVKVKSYAKKRKDLAGLKAAEYKNVWTVASKIKASDCGSCSSAGSCGSKSGQGAGGGGCGDEKGSGDDCGDEKGDGCGDKKGGGCSDK